MNTDKIIKTAINIVGFPFTLTNMYLTKKYQLKEIGLRVEVNDRCCTSYFDNVLRKKEKYNNPSIELVAVINNQIVGFYFNLGEC